MLFKGGRSRDRFPLGGLQMVQCWQTQRHYSHGLYIALMLKVSALLLFIDY